MGEKDGASLNHDPFFKRLRRPAIAVSGNHGDGERGVDIGQLLCIGNQVSQMDDLIGIVLLDGLNHTGSGAMRVGKYKNFQSCHLTCLDAYTGTEINLGVSGMQHQNKKNRPIAETAASLMQNRAAVEQLAKSGDAQRLMSMLKQSGGVQEAAQAAAGGDPSQLMAMMNHLMNSREGAELVERISRQAKESGLT